MAEDDKSKIISEIESLEQGVQSISDQLKTLKDKAKRGGEDFCGGARYHR